MSDEAHTNREEYRSSSSFTDLYASTANTLDKIREVIEQRLGAKPIRALIFSVYEDDGTVLLYQAGDLQDVLGLGQTAMQQAWRVVHENEHGHDEGEVLE